MVNKDILAALRNAIARSEDIEKAKQSLTNAGYPQVEVEEAASQVAQVRKTATQETGVPQTLAQQAGTPKKTQSKKKLILLIIILSILAFGIITFLLFKFAF